MKNTRKAQHTNTHTPGQVTALSIAIFIINSFAMIVCLLWEIGLRLPQNKNETLTFRRERMCLQVVGFNIIFFFICYSHNNPAKKGGTYKGKTLCSSISFAFIIWQCSDSNKYTKWERASPFIHRAAFYGRFSIVYKIYSVFAHWMPIILRTLHTSIYQSV